MSLNFETVSLGEHLYIKGRIGWKGLKKEEYLDQGDYRIINATALEEEGINWDDCGYISKERFEESPEIILKDKDILISKDGTIGKLGYVKNLEMDSTVASGIFVVRNQNEEYIDTDFLYYYFKSPFFKWFIKSVTEGSVIPHLYQRDFTDMEFNLFNLDTQKKCSSILNAIEEKINVNRKINKNLFNIASSLQREWMVNFTPFKSEQFKSSSFGLIPENWNVGKLGDVIELLDSKRIPLSGQERENMEKIYPYYGAASLMDYVDDYIFDGIYLLIGEDGTVVDDKGFPILQYVWGKFWVNNHAHIVKGKNGFNVDSLYLLLTKTNIQSIVTGAVQAKVNQNNLKSIEIIIPPVEVMEKFNELIKPFFDAIRSNHDKIKKLQKLRDTLLPKLMSGEIDVSKINCDLKIIIIKFILNPLKYLWRYLNENKDYIQNTKSNETLLKSRPIYKINKFFTKFTSRYRNYRQ